MKFIESLKPNQIFVFGSNANGNHAGGAARQAYDHFGAVNRQRLDFEPPTMIMNAKIVMHYESNRM